MGLRDFTLHDVWVRNARLHAGRAALVFEGGRVTHAEFLARVERKAAALIGFGVRSGDRVALLGDNSLDVVDVFGACARIGAVYTPINIRLAAEEVVATLADAEPRIVLLDPKYEALVAAGRGSLSSVEQWLTLGAEGEGSFASPDARGGDAAPFAATADTPVAMIYTAAVAGQPRGAVLSHGNLLSAASQIALNWRLGAEGVHLGLLPLFHVAGLLLTLVANAAGGATVLMSRFDAEAAIGLIETERATFFASFPPILGAILDRVAERGGADLSSLRVVTGLEGPDTIARLGSLAPGATFWATYGQAELGGLATMAPFHERPGSAGRANLHCTLAIVDEEDRPLPTGEAGDIVVRGPSVFQGYFRRDEDNAQTFRNGWHHTGDMGRLDADGYLWYTGRSPAKELIKPGGENVYPAEVERVLREHPAIVEAVVIGVPDAQWGEAVKAVCALAPGATAEAEEVIAFVGSRIARYKRPRHVVFVEALPRTAAGAVDRPKVKELHGSV